jgi:hypothetical protein
VNAPPKVVPAVQGREEVKLDDMCLFSDTDAVAEAIARRCRLEAS